MSFKIIMTTSMTRSCCTTQHQTCKTKTKTDFWSQTGLVPRPTTLLVVTFLNPVLGADRERAGGSEWAPIRKAENAFTARDHILLSSWRLSTFGQSVMTTENVCFFSFSSVVGHTAAIQCYPILLHQGFAEMWEPDL